jgi:hypothetical protein
MPRLPNHPMVNIAPFTTLAEKRIRAVALLGDE